MSGYMALVFSEMPILCTGQKAASRSSSVALVERTVPPLPGGW